MGKELKNAFLEAGFSDIRATATFDTYSAPEDIAFLYTVIGGWFFAPEVVGAATKYGLATQEQFDAWRSAVDRWKGHASAVGGIAFGEATGVKP